MTEAQDATGHGGQLAIAVAQAHGVRTLFTLSGAHIFPLYDGAVTATPPVQLLDVRHEQTAVFAAEATAKLTRTPGFAALTAGPGITNGVSAIASAWFNGSPVVVMGGRAPASRWGRGALQELDHPPILAPITKHASTVSQVDRMTERVQEAFRLAQLSHRGPVFLDVPMDQLYARSPARTIAKPSPTRLEPDGDDLAAVAGLIALAARPVLVLGSDVWADGADAAAVRFAEGLQMPVVANGMGRGLLPPRHPLLVTRARRQAFGEADLVLVAGAPLDFRLGYGVFGDPAGSQGVSKVVHLADSPGQVARHVALAGSAAGDLTGVLDGLHAACLGQRGHQDWAGLLRGAADAAIATDRPLLESTADPIHPARIYGELIPRLAHDSVVIGDGGDFVSFAGKYIEPHRPGGWLDPGPYGCLGTGLGYAIAARLARPSSQVVLLLGDGAAGFSLMDVDTLVRHRLPVVMIVGNNGVWGLEKQPMQFLYGYDVAADLAPGTRYDEVVRALGGDGELVTAPDAIGPALDRAFASPVPYLVNVLTDPKLGYPRSTTGI